MISPAALDDHYIASHRFSHNEVQTNIEQNRGEYSSLSHSGSNSEERFMLCIYSDVTVLAQLIYPTATNLCLLSFICLFIAVFKF